MFSKKMALALFVTLVALVIVAAQCGAPAEPVTIIQTVEVEKIVKETVEVEKEVVKEVEVEKTVEVEKVVEVTPTPDPNALGAQCTYNAYRMGWVMDYADPNNIVNEVFHPDSPFQYTFWDDETFRDLVNEALVTSDIDARIDLWDQAEDILINDAVAVLPIFHYDRTTLVRPGLNASFPPFGSSQMWKWSWEDGREDLVSALATDPPTLDPQLSTDTTSSAVIAQLMETMYGFKEDGTLEPVGAVGFPEISEDGSVFTVHLDPEAKWSDGEPVLAQHYVDGIIRLLEPETAAEYAYVMYYVDGAEAFNTGESDDPDSVGVKALDDFTLEFTLTGPQSFFDSILAFKTTFPARLDVIEAGGELWFETNYVGNGPYLLQEFVHDDHVSLVVNEDHVRGAQAAIKTIEMPIIVEQATRLAAFEQGDIDLGYPTAPFPSEELPRILEDPFLSEAFTRLPQPGTYYVGLNTRGEHTSNVDFRKALEYAVDKRSILDDVMNMPWRIDAYGVIPPEIYGYQDGNVGYGFDVDAALEHLQAYMDEAGIEDPGDISIQLWFNRGNEDIIQSVEVAWEENLGIDVNVVNMEWGVYLDTLDECNNP
jgi:oligopeptide transport system substrate-binding protein